MHLIQIICPISSTGSEPNLQTEDKVSTRVLIIIKRDSVFNKDALLGCSELQVEIDYLQFYIAKVEQIWGPDWPSLRIGVFIADDDSIRNL